MVRSLQKHPSAIHSVCWCSPSSLLTTCESGIVMYYDFHHSQEAPFIQFDINMKLQDYVYTIQSNKLNKKQSSLEADLNNDKMGIFSICHINTLVLPIVNSNMPNNSRQSYNRSNQSANLIIALGCSKGYLIIYDILQEKVLLVDKSHNDDIRTITTCSVSSTGATITSNSTVRNDIQASIDKQNNITLLVTGSYDHTACVWQLSPSSSPSSSSESKTSSTSSSSTIGAVESPQLQLTSWGKFIGHTDKILSCTVIPSTCSSSSKTETNKNESDVTRTRVVNYHNVRFLTTSADGTSRMWFYDGTL